MWLKGGVVGILKAYWASVMACGFASTGRPEMIRPNIVRKDAMDLSTWSGFRAFLPGGGVCAKLSTINRMCYQALMYSVMLVSAFSEMR